MGQRVNWHKSAVCAVILSITACSLPPKPTTLPLQAYVSDGCSLWPDMDYVHCCEQHDRSYWQGGTPKERKVADQKLRQCVNQKGRPVNAFMMYMGTRIGGHGWLPSPFRWGFGYPWPQGYFSEEKSLTK